ncbi:MAG: CAP domain-containing protein [Thaumarchaeota archaeon]|nr:CAP domain-containing protein [Nitrososphaerota archaeon]
MGKTMMVTVAAITLLIIVGLAGINYLPTGVNHQPVGASTGSATTSTASPVGSTASGEAARTVTNSAGSWLPDDPAFGNSSKIDYPPDYSILANFTLGLVNKDRVSAGLGPVTLSNVPSGQQHADSMAYYGYFSHWDNQGYKPYMRYTLLGGTGSVEENAALNYCNTSPADSPKPTSAPCSLKTVENAINSSEWEMMNNDTVCCSGGHRSNILGPIHNRVSVGVAYNSTTVFLVEDFENSYISAGSVQLSAGVVTFLGSLQQGGSSWMGHASGAEITVYHDPMPSDISVNKLSFLPVCDKYNELNEPTGCQYQGAYNPGTQISTVFPPCPANHTCAGGNYTYAQSWLENSGNFEIVFPFNELQSAYGSGVYTFYLWPAASAPEPITSLSVFVGGA